ncbi:MULTISPECIES: ankyrin repeat domain-containing protein [unclassified Bosea (in: a-proteobacteria)]|uniref:ankyrin repeat domain-containing protein n=1 Tax=unclassified Bosea (in: a-proteobacteria) TaxID=2653178 RepID=UPI000F75EA27|nr:MULTISPECIES: ankyrin repeat domain-containing protein [unclassified Bosea (in: a-proteobacteria)]AZO79927.1 hypothetical protein BLM15_21755 [Bosea sp. Tri-49]RXT26901.1 hypothetical protein B5U98_02745 [Bosea sp. Tri-39]RXT39501.1 hypothetical protein B5U99_04675 [Bosea sp. Tri-54]
MGDKPQLDSQLVQDFVRNAHGNFDKVTALVSEHPTLVNAVWDWGGGDWESGLGAAAHTGRREIAEFLLARGARMDIFAAAMLGHLDLVRAHLAAVPTALTASGPHGIPLITHAKMGGALAAPVLDYLQGLQDGSTAADSAKNG